MFSCLILHQRNTERSGTEMEVGSRKCFHCKMFYNVQLPYISVSRSGAEQRWKKGPGNILQCSVALFYISVTPSGAERRWKKGPGNVPIVKCSTMFSCLILHQRNAERSGTEMFSCLILHQRNSERSGTEMEERSRKCFHCKMFYNVQLPYST